MAELVPILGGLVAGFAIGQRFQPGRRRTIRLLAASVVIGIFAGIVTGELAQSAAFLAIDIPAALLAAVVAVFALDRLGSRASREATSA
jgi:hypothetical protein